MTVRTNNGFNTTFGVDARNQLTTQPNGTATYDASGNLTGDGVRGFTYNAENQMVSVSAGTSYRNDFVYDGLGRLRRKLEYVWSGGAWSLYGETRYVMDGRRVVQERNGSDVPQAGYTWGQDVSGSLEGAGGIGGLLGRSHGYSAGSWSTHHHYHADGGGNVTALMDSAQALSATYRYDSYGNLLSSSGSMAGANLMRFSSKLWMASPGLYYYGFRFYEPNFQRWVNRDPLGEDGSEVTRNSISHQKHHSRRGIVEIPQDLNLYVFVGNNPLRYIDPHGLEWLTPEGMPSWMKGTLRAIRCSMAAVAAKLFSDWYAATDELKRQPAKAFWIDLGFGIGTVSYYDSDDDQSFHFPSFWIPKYGPVIFYAPDVYVDEIRRRAIPSA